MDCCTVEGTGRFFSGKARRTAKHFRKKGLEKAQRMLTESIIRQGIDEKSIIEIGCGVGSVHLTLLSEGAGSSVGIDLSEGMLDEARSLANEMGHAEKATYRLGDFVGMDGELGQADITILDSVICCYEDAEKLVAESLAKTRHTYAIVYPRPNWLGTTLFRILIAVFTLLPSDFRPYLHDLSRIRRWIRDGGFVEVYSNHTAMWIVLVYAKEQDGFHS